MKNLTLRIDEKVLAAARKRAALDDTTVAKVVREFLEYYAAALMRETSAAEGASATPVAPERQGFAEPSTTYDASTMPEPVAKGPLTLEEMTTDTGAPPEPGHDAWFRRQVQKALDDKKAGAKYEDFATVAAEFGFNAR